MGALHASLDSFDNLSEFCVAVHKAISVLQRHTFNQGIHGKFDFSIMCGDQYYKPAHQWFVWVATSDIEQLLSVQACTCTMQHVHNVQNVAVDVCNIPAYLF